MRSALLGLQECLGGKLKCLPSSPKALAAFWETQKSFDWFKSHPILSQPVPWPVQWIGVARPANNVGGLRPEDFDMTHTIPLVWHGDDADSHRRRTFCVTTISSPLLPMQSSWDTKIVCYIVDNHKCTNDTFEVLDIWMVHSFMELQTGVFFDVDPWNQKYERGKSGRIMGPWNAVLVGLKGDQKYIQRILRPNNSWISSKVCLYCNATQEGKLAYSHFGRGAPHRSTILSNEQFLLHAIRPNPWMRLPGFHVELVLLDFLHLIDLAVTPEVAASVASLW